MRKTGLYQHHQFPLGVLVSGDIETGCQICVAGKLFKIAQTGSDFRNPTDSFRQKSAPSGM